MNKLSLLKTAYVLVGTPSEEDPDDFPARLANPMHDVILGIPHAESRKAIDLAISGKSNITDDDILEEDMSRFAGGFGGGMIGMLAGAKAGKALVNNPLGRILLGAAGLTAGLPLGAMIGSRATGTVHHALYGPEPSAEDRAKMDKILEADV